jgi:hypothetical protein
MFESERFFSVQTVWPCIDKLLPPITREVATVVLQRPESSAAPLVLKESLVDANLAHQEWGSTAVDRRKAHMVQLKAASYLVKVT